MHQLSIKLHTSNPLVPFHKSCNTVSLLTASEIKINPSSLSCFIHIILSSFSLSWSIPRVPCTQHSAYSKVYTNLKEISFFQKPSKGKFTLEVIVLLYELTHTHVGLGSWRMNIIRKEDVISKCISQLENVSFYWQFRMQCWQQAIQFLIIQWWRAEKEKCCLFSSHNYFLYNWLTSPMRKNFRYIKRMWHNDKEDQIEP